MKYSCTKVEIIVIASLFYCNLIGIRAKSIRIRTTNHNMSLASPHIIYPRVKLERPIQSAVTEFYRKDEINRQIALEPIENGEDIIQTTFNTGFRSVFQYLRQLVSNYAQNGIPNVSMVRIPGFPTTSIFHKFDVSSIVKLLEATDPSQVEGLMEAAVVDIVSQLFRIIGFNDLRDWMGIIIMSFVLGPIMIPLFWLPIALFGMLGLLTPLFLFNPPSKLNANFMGHDPIIPAREAGNEGRSLENLLFNSLKHSSPSKEPASSVSLVESCMERVSCHVTRFYRANPISQWLTSHFNTTKVAWARVHPGDDVDENGISSWEDCKKYQCSIFPAV